MNSSIKKLDQQTCDQINNRRSFAIISHPDAGKTTLTESFLHIAKAINMIGTVKAKKSKVYARSDWLEIEKKRGISVTSSVLKFQYDGFEINLIDTPGHQDFSEDTYRTLTAVDSTLMVLDGANGVEAQTKKLFEVCKMRDTPSVGFINKMDRPSKDPFELMEEIEKTLGVNVCFIVWPIISEQGKLIALYHYLDHKIIFFNEEKPQDTIREVNIRYDHSDFKQYFFNHPQTYDKLIEDLTMIEELVTPWNRKLFLHGKLIPLFFGSAMKNLGIELLLKHFVNFAPPPQPRITSKEITIDPLDYNFSAFIFKIQANMDPDHRDRIAFMRICSGVFTRDMKVYHVRKDRYIRLSRPTKFLAKDRSIIDKAFSGDIVGIHDPGVFSIGDTLTSGKVFHFLGLPVFSPEHFALVQLSDPLKSKTLIKGLNQLSEEGAVQVFRSMLGNRLELGVVGELQFDVVKFRLKSEYLLDVSLNKLPYGTARWLQSDKKSDLDNFINDNRDQIYLDNKNHPVIFVDQEWRVELWKQRNPQIQFKSTAEILDHGN